RPGHLACFEQGVLVLAAVVTDAYFRATDRGKDKDALLKARTMSWSLTYFLAQKHLDHLMRYYQALAALPRDMEFGEDALLNLFVRSFELGSANGDEFRKLAREWFSHTADTHVEVQEAFKEAEAKEDFRVKKMKAEAEGKKEPKPLGTQP